MQLQNLFKPLESLSDDELRQRLQEIRHNRTVARPAAKARTKRAESKGRAARVNKVESLLAGLSKEQIEELLAEMGDTNG